MKNTKKVLIALLACIALCIVSVSSTQFSGGEVKAAQREVVATEINGSTLYYRAAYMTDEFLADTDVINTVGRGESKEIKFAKNAKFYLIKFTDGGQENIKVSKKKFVKEINRNESQRCEEEGEVYYTGTYLKLTIKNGKCTKAVQLYQP